MLSDILLVLQLLSAGAVSSLSDEIASVGSSSKLAPIQYLLLLQSDTMKWKKKRILLN
jgi:hypothetical protein